MANIATLILVGASVQALTPKVATLLRPLGFPVHAVALVMKIAMSTPYTALVGKEPEAGIAVAVTDLTEATFRAAYILAAAERMTTGLRQGKPERQLVEQEHRFYEQHLAMQERRLLVARAVDQASKKHGPLLGWYSVRDHRTTPECRRAHGKNFRVEKRPLIGYPGSVHPACRCKPGPPHRGGRMLDGSKSGMVRSGFQARTANGGGL